MIVGVISPQEKIATKLLNSGIQITTIIRSPKNSNELRRLNPDILICRNRDNISQFVRNCPNLKFIFIPEVGLEKIPFQELIQRNIRVANVSGISADIMSNYAMACILSNVAKLEENYENKHKHFWKPFQCTDSLYKKTLLIVGAGRTGRQLGKKAKSFGMSVIGVVSNKREIDSFDEVGTLDNLNTYLSVADYVVSVVPLTPLTQSLFNIDRFRHMKPNSVFINISRGAVINERDLLNAIDECCFSKAYLDVFDEEPLPSDHLFWDNPKVIVTPHQSGRLSGFMDKAIDMFIDNYYSFCNGERMPNEVDLIKGY